MVYDNAVAAAEYGVAAHVWLCFVGIAVVVVIASLILACCVGNRGQRNRRCVGGGGDGATPDTYAYLPIHTPSRAAPF